MSWRRSISIAALSGLIALQAAGAAPFSELNPVVETGSGKVSGFTLPSGVRTWQGIPFAAPPTNNLRWQPPQNFSWKGIWRADRFAPECIQNLRPHNINNYFGEEPSSEDCLYLNIWAPAQLNGASKLPVIVYIFGGGNTIGPPGMPLYSGEHIASRGAIFVSMNYRLGILGFMAHPELSAEQGGHSGNYAYLDQNAALKWIKENIARFGGDPSRISIVGQSAGAGAIAQHVASPLSKGLFSSAVMLSVCRLDGSSPTLAQAEQAGLAVQSQLGAKSIAEMRALPADRILAAQGSAMISPVVDGHFQPRPMVDSVREHRMNAVPVIASSTGDDSDSKQSPLTKATTVSEFRNQVSSLYGSDATALLKLYPAATDAEVSVTAHHIAQDGGMQGGSRHCAQVMNENNLGKTYIALFDRKHSYAPGVAIADQDPATIGAYHSSDVAFWLGTLDAFNTIRPTRAWTHEDREVSGRMMDALIAFARNGDPSTASLKWPAWSPKNEQRLEVGRDISVRPLRTVEMDWLAAHRLTPQQTRPVPRRDAD